LTLPKNTLYFFTLAKYLQSKWGGSKKIIFRICENFYPGKTEYFNKNEETVMDLRKHEPPTKERNAVIIMYQ